MGAPFVPLFKPRIAVCGFLKRFTSVNERLEKFTPTSGPFGRLTMPGGKCCCTMNPAVRELKACWSLLKNAAVPALVIASSRSSAAGGAPFTLQTPSTNPSRSTTAMTALDETAAARVAACAMTVATSLEVIWPETGQAASRPSKAR